MDILTEEIKKKYELKRTALPPPLSPFHFTFTSGSSVVLYSNKK